MGREEEDVKDGVGGRDGGGEGSAWPGGSMEATHLSQY